MGEKMEEVIHYATLDNPELNVLHARRIGKTRNMLMTIEGTKLPRQVTFRDAVLFCYPYKEKLETCFNCRPTGHRADVCRQATSNKCRSCVPPLLCATQKDAGTVDTVRQKIPAPIQIEAAGSGIHQEPGPLQAWGYPRSLLKGVAIWNTLQTDHLTLITDPDYPTREGNSVFPDTTPDLSITRNIPLATRSNTRNTLGTGRVHYSTVSGRPRTRSPPPQTEGRADAKLLHMWQALGRLRARWSKQKQNRSLRKRISRLERDI
ncbi:hypothetical protein HPB47_022948 [Ixodes persulcatus]|uniref:Uncharacterized protein n=1 Tax=Ixodes persulcatus TaxID=34615 RepID=A0AC60QAP4_IXOPE|nr:hypothetical protein HPB47_022948 [Ixodes persulcatus]